DRMNGSSVFSTLDATSGYYQINLSEQSKPLTAFSFNRGHYEFNKMAMGLCNAPATFQRLMDSIFPADMYNFVLPYLDDLIVFSKNKLEHQSHLKQVFEVLKNAKIFLNMDKCHLFKDELIILGNLVSKGSIKPDPDKIKSILAHKLPSTAKELRSFLGIVNFCREYIPKITDITKILYELLKGTRPKSDSKIIHTKESKKAFINIKQIIASNLERAQPDLSKPFILTTDAS
ncbi:putative LTR retrotransposable element, partial [Pseudoloma neurophilia]